MLVIHQLCCICIAYIVRCACTKQCETHCVLPQCWNDIEMREHRRCTFVLYINIILLIYIFYLDLGVFLVRSMRIARSFASIRCVTKLIEFITDTIGLGRIWRPMHSINVGDAHCAHTAKQYNKKTGPNNKQKKTTKHTAAVATNTIDQPHYYKHTPKRNMAGLALYGGIARW